MSEGKPEIGFDKFVKPTREQAKDLWNSIKSPSSRKAADLARKRGWEISAKTFARWHNEGWVEKERKPASKAQKKITRATRELRKAANELTSTDELKANPLIQEAMQALKKAEYEPRKLGDLLKLDKAELKDAAEKVLLATTIIVAEAVCEKASVISLTPQEVGKFVESGQNATKAIAPGDEVPGAVKTETATDDPPVPPPNPVTNEILAFKRKIGAV